MVGDPNEGAVVVAAAKAGLDPETERETLPKVSKGPFYSRERRMVTVFDVSPSTHITFAKGVPEAILPACNRVQRSETVADLVAAGRERLWKVNTEMAGKALRVLALAYKETNRDHEDEQPFSNLIFLGFVGMIDPPRPEAKEAIRLCQQAGIHTVIITGDQKTTTEAIARELDTLPAGGNAAGGSVLDGAALEAADDAELQELVASTSVYARVSPEHKLRIVRALQERNQTVAMTGDGVNDAPVLKAADIGVAMGRMGTNMARRAADRC